MKDSDQAWRKLVAAARKVPAPEVEKPVAPTGLAGRIIGLRQTIVALARVLFWRRWSAMTAVICFLLLMAVFVIHRCTDTRPPILDAPEFLPNHP